MQNQITIKNPSALFHAVDDLSNILDAVGAISALVQDDLTRRGCEGDQPFLNDTLHGGLMSALQQLSSRGAEALDRIEYVNDGAEPTFREA